VNVELARATSWRGDVVLMRRERDDAVELRVNGVFVMDNVETSSERMLARATLSTLPDLESRPLDVLVGGLGLGYTLAEVLADRRVRQVTVAEIEGVLVDWHRDGTLDDALEGASPVNDDRVVVQVGDVKEAIEAAPSASFDLILLDVDNGPGFLVYDANAAVYEEAFLTTCAERTRRGGVTAVWSAETAPELLSTMDQVFDHAEEWPIPVVLGQRATTYHLFLGRVAD
jgi:spermidine synthase